MPQLLGDVESVLDAVGKVYGDEYGRLAAAWRDLETKAAGVTTISGILLGFVLNFIKDLRSGMSGPQRILAWATLAGLIATLSVAIIAVAVREHVRPPRPDFLYRSVINLYHSEDRYPPGQYTLGLQHDVIRHWNVAVDNRAAENQKKARWVQVGQYLLLLSMVLTATLAVVTIP